MSRLKSHPRVFLVVMDGVGISESDFGNAFSLAKTPNLDALKEQSLCLELAAHGRAVGLESDGDMGNSEVGHNALGAGQIFDQGSKLVSEQMASGAIFEGDGWETIISKTRAQKGRLHFLGLLSDGNVHSHTQHLEKMILQAKKDGISEVFVHALLDGRDVEEKSAEKYLNRLLTFFSEVNDGSFQAQLASGGGRMMITMDRYEADWEMVRKGWKVHVEGEAEYSFSDPKDVLPGLRKTCSKSDQFLPSFVMLDSDEAPVGKIFDGDGVICFNFRGDRVIEISQAFTDNKFSSFDRARVPKLASYAGMMLYDGDAQIPPLYLVSPPEISGTMGEYLVGKGLRQFACSETQKFGHVTYFWNGNRSRKFSEDLEHYVEIPSDLGSFDKNPVMKAREIADASLKAIEEGSFDFGRINFANGDMVGHTGNFEASLKSVEALDKEIGRLRKACKKNNISLIVTADHGNCEEMLSGSEEEFPNWQKKNHGDKPSPKTSHTLNPVPCYILPAKTSDSWALDLNIKERGLANIAATCLRLLSLDVPERFQPSLVKRA